MRYWPATAVWFNLVSLREWYSAPITRVSRNVNPLIGHLRLHISFDIADNRPAFSLLLGMVRPVGMYGPPCHRSSVTLLVGKQV